MENKLNHSGGFVLPVEEFFGWLPLSSLLVMILNNHYFRIKYPNFLTGILSDIAVLLFFPSLLTASLDTLLYIISLFVWKFTRGKVFIPFALTKGKVVFSVVISGFILSGINVSRAINEWYIKLLYFLDIFNYFKKLNYTMDKWDLLALAVLPVSIWWGFRCIKMQPESFRLQQERLQQMKKDA